MAEPFAYLLFNLGTLLGGLTILTCGKLWPDLKWRALGVSYLLVSGGFIAWDYVATTQGHWGFNPTYTTGLAIAGVPIEELLFFFTVPFACLAVYLLAKKHLGERKLPRNVFAGIIFTLFLIALLPMRSLDGDYTFVVVLAFLAAIATTWNNRSITIYWRFWVFLAVSFVLFLAANTFLTALPVVTYAESAIAGVRFGTIPLEDFAYNFALLSFFVITYEVNIEK